MVHMMVRRRDVDLQIQGRCIEYESRLILLSIDWYIIVAGSVQKVWDCQSLESTAWASIFFNFDSKIPVYALYVCQTAVC